MQRIKSSGAVAVLPEREENSYVPGYFSGGDPATGRRATVVSADWLNDVQEEIIGVLNEADISPEAGRQNQLSEAVKKLAQGAVDGNTDVSSKTAIALGSSEVRKLEDRFSDIVNVKDFGAVGDGVTDDTEAIQAAVNAGTNGTPVFFSEPDVTYLTSASIVIPSGVSIIGTQKSNYGKPTIKYIGTDAAIISGEYGSTAIRGGSITNFHIKLMTAGSTGYRIHLTRDARWTGLMCSYDADNCTGFLFDGAGGGVFDCTFIDLLSLNEGHSGIQHFELRGDDSSGNSGRVNANAFIRLSARGAGHGYKIGPSLINGFYACLGEGLTDGYITFLSGASNNVFHDSYLGDSGSLLSGALVVDFQEGSKNNAIINARFTAGAAFSRCVDNGNGNYLQDYHGRVVIGQLNFYDSSESGTSINKNFLKNHLIKIIGSNSYNGINIIGNSYSNNDESLFGANLYFSTSAISPSYPDGSQADGVYNNGQANRRWNNIYAATGSINTSDAREKQDVSEYPDEVLDAWGDVGLRQFLFADAVERKGEAARIHAGVIAQQVVEAFEKHGLDATRYGLLCYDKWEDEYEDVEVVDAEAVFDAEGNEVTPAQTHMEKRLVTAAGDRYGIRYSEALCMEAAYQRRRTERLEGRMASLETQLTALEERMR